MRPKLVGVGVSYSLARALLFPFIDAMRFKRLWQLILLLTAFVAALLFLYIWSTDGLVQVRIK